VNARQQLFVLEYLKDQNGTQAAIRAGYSPKTAESQSSRLLRNAKVGDAIAKKMEARNQTVKIDADYVLARLAAIDLMDVLDILNDDLTFKPLTEWPLCWRTTLSAIDVSEIIMGSGEDRNVAILKKIKWPDKTKNLELLGKHVDVQAFKERVDHLHAFTYEDLVCGPEEGKTDE